MRVRLVRGGVWRVYAVCDDRGTCALATYLEGARERAAIMALLDRVAKLPAGPRDLPDDICHSIAEDVWQLRKGESRVLWFYDKGRVVICTHAFAKKSRKTPRGEVDRALTLRAAYFEAQRRGELIFEEEG